MIPADAMETTEQPQYKRRRRRRPAPSAYSVAMAAAAAAAGAMVILIGGPIFADSSSDGRSYLMRPRRCADGLVSRASSIASVAGVSRRRGLSSLPLVRGGASAVSDDADIVEDGGSSLPHQTLPLSRKEKEEVYDEIGNLVDDETVGCDGGSQPQEEPFSSASRPSILQPLIDVRTVSVVLRASCELNRALQWGASSSLDRCHCVDDGCGDGGPTSPHLHLRLFDDAEERVMRSRLPPDDGADPVHHQHPPPQSMQAVNPHGYPFSPPRPPPPTSSSHRHRSQWPPAPRLPSMREIAAERRAALTVFHRARPVSSSSLAEKRGRKGASAARPTKRGVERWGPPIDAYLDALLLTLGLGPSTTDDEDDSKDEERKSDERQAVLALSLLYLDRACSSGEEGDSTGTTCPYPTPRTVHRLLLTAVVLACRRVRGLTGVGRIGGDDVGAEKLSSTFGVSPSSLRAMESWMVHALGGEASWWFVFDERDVTTFLRKWGADFYPHRLDERLRREESERNAAIERERRIQLERMAASAIHWNGLPHHHNHHHPADRFDPYHEPYHFHPHHQLSPQQHPGDSHQGLHHWERPDYHTGPPPHAAGQFQDPQQQHQLEQNNSPGVMPSGSEEEEEEEGGGDGGGGAVWA